MLIAILGRKTRHKRHRTLTITGLFLAILAGSGVALVLLPKRTPPVDHLDRARSSLKRAEEAGASRFAEETYARAESLLQRGWMEMAYQDGRLRILRRYWAADSLLSLAVEVADRSAQEAQARCHSLDSLSRSERTNLEVNLREARDILDDHLTDYEAERHWSSAELALRTSDILIDQGKDEEALEVIRRGNESLDRIYGILGDSGVEDSKAQSWRLWVQETLAESRRTGGFALIVDKSEHKMYLVHAGDLMHTYRCDLGYNSSADKLYAGDGATPEGKYRVTAIKQSSKYYKALLLDYPTEQDRVRFRDNKVQGTISDEARIGGLIEIHGEGGKSKDWTDGCIALSNRDLDRLLNYSGNGMPVTIVRRSDQWP